MKKLLKAISIIGVLGAWIPIFADGSPWLPVPQTLNVTVSVVNQEATQFYRGEEKRDLPFNKFTQDTRWVDMNYGVGDKTAIDFRFGVSDVDAQAAGSVNQRMDTTFGVTRSLRDELENEDFSLAIRIAATLAGDYETGGSPAAPGDGGDAVSGSLLIGKFMTERFALAGDGTIRLASNDVPTEISFSIGAHVVAASNLGLYAQFQKQHSMGDLDIGEAGFAGRFPEVQENVSRIRVGGNTSIGPVGVDLSFYQVLGGRNTADYEIFNAAFSYTFDFFRGK